MSLTLPLVALCLAQGESQDPALVAERIGSTLRCPVCQGMPIAESPSQMAQDMMKRVREMAAEGKSEAEIVDYFVGRYGEWVQLDPPKQGMNLLLWILPAGALLAGGAALLLLLRRRRPVPPVAPPKVDAELVARIRDEVEP